MIILHIVIVDGLSNTVDSYNHFTRKHRVEKTINYRKQQASLVRQLYYRKEIAVQDCKEGELIGQLHNIKQRLIQVCRELFYFQDLNRNLITKSGGERTTQH